MTDQPPAPQLPEPKEGWITKLAQLSIIGAIFAFFLWLLDSWVADHFALMKMFVDKMP